MSQWHWGQEDIGWDPTAKFLPRYRTHSTFRCPLSPITESKTKTYVDFVQLPTAVSGADLYTCYQVPSHQTCCWNAEDLKVRTFSSRASEEGEWSRTRNDLTTEENNTIFPRTLDGLWSWNLQLHRTVTWRRFNSSGQHSACSCYLLISERGEENGNI